MSVIPDGWVSIFDLARELATPGADRSADEARSDVRRELDIAFNVHGWSDASGAERPTPGVVKHLRKMAERGEIRPLFGESGFPASDAEEITDTNWWLSPQDAMRVRDRLSPPQPQPPESSGGGCPQNPQNQSTPIEDPSGVALAASSEAAGPTLTRDEVASAFANEKAGVGRQWWIDQMAGQKSKWLMECRASRGTTGGDQVTQSRWFPVLIAQRLVQGRPKQYKPGT